MRDRHGGVRAGRRALEQQGAGRGGRPLDQALALLSGCVAQWPFQQRAHHAESEVALERAGRGPAHAAAGLRRLARGVLEQRGPAETGGRREDDDPAGAAGQPRHRGAQGIELACPLDQGRLGAGRERALRADDAKMPRLAAAAGRGDRLP